MNLNLERPLLFFDIESTGLNIATDCIAELSFVKIFPDGEQRIKTWKLCPWNYVARCQQPMNPSASEVNGLKDEDLAGCPKFHEVVDEVVEWLTDSDLAGFNSAKFDLPMLAEEIERVRLFLNRNIDLILESEGPKSSLASSSSLTHFTSSWTFSLMFPPIISTLWHFRV